MYRRSVFYLKIGVFFISRAEKNPLKMSLSTEQRKKGVFMKTELTKQEKNTDIGFDEKEPTIHIRPHNTV